jgi:hypothetical protein
VDVGVVIGGGRWGRIIAGKLSGLGYQVFVATDFPKDATDITRADIARLAPKPKLIYVASRSTDHEKDFMLVASVGVPVWIEKNFSGMSEALIHKFSAGDNFVFTQQLFNCSLDHYADHLRQLPRFHIETEVEKRIETHIGLFDWLCHDLALIARILWLRGEAGHLTVTSAIEFADGVCVADYVVNGVVFRIVLRESSRRCRSVQLADGASLVSGYDGLLWRRSNDRTTDCADGGSIQNDLLGTALKVALGTSREDAHSLTRIVLHLHRETFPLIRQLVIET